MQTRRDAQARDGRRRYLIFHASCFHLSFRAIVQFVRHMSIYRLVDPSCRCAFCAVIALFDPFEAVPRRAAAPTPSLFPPSRNVRLPER